MKFQCRHCSLCCSDSTMPINLTLGDIYRITSFLKTEFSKLFWNHITIFPFPNPEYPLLYDFELGLRLPCRFRKNQRCSIYKARPLNCRLFPYWLLSNPNKDGYKEYIGPTRKCIKDYKEDSINKKNYLEYKHKVGNIILQESSLTEHLFSKNNLKKSISLPGDLPFPPSIPKQKEIWKIMLCSKKINKVDYKELPHIIAHALKDNTFHTVEELEIIDQIIT
ncbi:MAG: YkgJ family cysteine cluster protein [Candidatus Woesearchaeota archaeon]|nr:YkgJ family cysteine cluster protein [Candidatus Woesearchaeota archaeon]